MENAQNEGVTSAGPLDTGRKDGGITLANTRWATLNGLPASRRQREPGEGRHRRLAPRPSGQESPWRAADRALAEIAAANRGELARAGKERVMLERATAAVRDSLLEAAQAAADASRRAQALADLLDETLVALGEDQGSHLPLAPAAMANPAPPQASALSQREREVLSRVAEGRSNKAIAEDLFVSPNTVKTHVASLLRKLNVHTRTQLATIAVQQGIS